MASVEGVWEDGASLSDSGCGWEEESLDLSDTSRDTAATCDSLGAAARSQDPTSAAGLGASSSEAAFAHLFPHGRPDEFLHCELCGWVRDACEAHPPDFLEDDPDAALATPAALRLLPDGLAALQPIPKGTLMGPYEGPSKRDFPAQPLAQLAFVWEVRTYDGHSAYFLPEAAADQSHWTARVPRVHSRAEQNLFPVQFKGDVYYRASRDVGVGERLGVFCGTGLPVAKGDTEGLAAPEEAGALECGLCPAAHFTSYEARAAHLRGPRHRPVDDVRCRACDYVARNRHGLRAHTVASHRDAPFRCSFCRRAFASGARLDDHVAKRHSGTAPLLRHFPCTKCPKAFFKRHHLARHLALHDNPRFACPKCPAALRSAETLRLHLDTVHSGGETPFKCAVCPKAFASSIYLQRHQTRVHKPRKPKALKEPAPKAPPALDCRFCGQRMANRGSRIRHEQRKHREDFDRAVLEEQESRRPRKFQCEHCPAGFDNASSFHYHKVRHSGRFPVSCALCQRGYVTPSELRKHLRLSHPQAPADTPPGPPVTADDVSAAAQPLTEAQQGALAKTAHSQGPEWDAIKADMARELSDQDDDELSQ